MTNTSLSPRWPTAITKAARLMLVLVSLLIPFQVQAQAVSSDIERGVAADLVIANALAAGLTPEEVMDEIAQSVGSNNIGLFNAALMRVLATASGAAIDSPGVQNTANSAIGAASANNHPGTAAGNAYTFNNANFAPVSEAEVFAITGGTMTFQVVTAFNPRSLGVGPGAQGRRGFGLDDGPRSQGNGGVFTVRDGDGNIVVRRVVSESDVQAVAAELKKTYPTIYNNAQFTASPN